MRVSQAKLTLHPTGPGPLEITGDIQRELKRVGLQQGVVSVFCQHTSCSLMVMENADPSAWSDLHRWFARLVPENDPHFVHTLEGADDMPSHIKMALTRTSETIPVSGGRLALGTWQGVFLWEHRDTAPARTVMLTFMGV